MMRSSIRGVLCACAAALIGAICLCAPGACAAQSSPSAALPATASATMHFTFPAEAHESLDALYRGDAEAAIVIARQMETSRPEYSLGYLLEGEALWWKIYCRSLEFKWGQIDAWSRGPAPEDEAYLRLADKAISLAENQLQQKETAEMQLYAGMGYALRARLLGLRKENRATAHAGVKAREHLLRAQELDAQLADARTGIGLYNYYVDTLSGIARVLRFFMGIPGGNKQDGIKQLEDAMVHGELTAVDARFYLAKNLRIYDQQYQRSLEVLEPLAAQYPQNPVFALLIGNLNALLGRNEKAAVNYHAAEMLADSLPEPEVACKTRVRAIAREALGIVKPR